MFGGDGIDRHLNHSDVILAARATAAQLWISVADDRVKVIGRAGRRRFAIRAGSRIAAFVSWLSRSTMPVGRVGSCDGPWLAREGRRDVISTFAFTQADK
jgi:hypothetical protein